MKTVAIAKTNQYLSFKLGNEIYALDVGNAREIVECSLITQIPKMPPWIRGVINLRGTVVPVLDLKRKFEMGQTEQTVNTCVIIVESILDGEMFVIGVLADAVQEVFELESSKIEPPPKFGSKVSTRYLKGMGRRGDMLFIVLDAEKVFSGAELAEAQEAADLSGPVEEQRNEQDAESSVQV